MAVTSIPTSFHVGLAVIAFYIIFTSMKRLVWSPLASIPGPKLAALTRWYECFYDVFLPGQYCFKIKKLHEIYGPIVRISPSEVSISDPDFVSTIYTPSPGTKRDKDPQNIRSLGINSSVGGAWQHDLHRRRRESLNSFFSRSRILQLDSELRGRVAQLSVQLNRAAATGECVNLSDLYFALANDTVCKYCFGHDSDFLSDSQRASLMRSNTLGPLRAVKINLQFSWIQGLIRMLPANLRARLTPQGVKDMQRFRAEIRQEVLQVLDRKAEPAQATGGSASIFHELRDSTSLPDAEKTVQRLEDEATLLVIAGTTSTALSLERAHYYLIAKPEVMDKLRSELSTSQPQTLAELEGLPWLSGIIQEAHRLSFGLTGRNSRICPDSTVTYTNKSTGKKYLLPPGTPMNASTLLIHTDESVFPDPWEFRPERWQVKEGLARRKCMMAFGKGPRQCVGMHLANAQLALAIAEMARWNMELFETDERDVKFLHDYHVTTPRLDSKGVRARVLGSQTT